MCCPLDSFNGNLRIQSVSYDDQTRQLVLTGTFDRTPENFADRMFRAFQRIEVVEKIAEIADESFHLLGSTLQIIASVPLYQTFRMIHNAAHDVEHLLHAICFLGDVSRLFTGKFIERRSGPEHEIDHVRTISRICHAVAHFFATMQFLSDQKLLKIARLEPYLRYSSVFSSLGYAIWTSTLIWRRHQDDQDERFASDLGIHLGGFFFESIPLMERNAIFASHASKLSKLSALAGIVHAWNVVQRLIPPDTEQVSAKCSLPHPLINDQAPDDDHHSH